MKCLLRILGKTDPQAREVLEKVINLYGKEIHSKVPMQQGIDSECESNSRLRGDIIQHLRLDKNWRAKDFSQKNWKEELWSSTIDLAVHSHKDFTDSHPPGLIIAAVSNGKGPAELLIVLKDCVDIEETSFTEA
ncbi:hypothetical protein FQR65_LT17647 [Abscondita terminalis]|nr:hypothetical protein FQR65_LT17647 [Abscondita terminalis]